VVAEVGHREEQRGILAGGKRVRPEWLSLQTRRPLELADIKPYSEEPIAATQILTDIASVQL
jgi:hypothetical protein